MFLCEDVAPSGALRSRLTTNSDEIRDEDPLFRYEIFEDDGRRHLARDHDEELYGDEPAEPAEPDDDETMP
jgi:hypothetical protein